MATRILLFTTFTILITSGCATPAPSKPASLTYAADLPVAKTQDAEGSIQEVIGDVQIRSVKTNQLTPVVAGQKVPLKDSIVTGKGGRVKIVMYDNNEFDVAPQSEMKIQKYEASSAKKNVSLDLIYGKIRAKVRQKYNGNSDRFQINTPAAVAGVRGTDFMASFDKNQTLSQIVTFEGAVEFGLPGTDGAILNPVSVAAGQKSQAMPNLPPSQPKMLPKDELEQFKQEVSLKAAPESAEDASTTASSMDPEKAFKWLRNGNIRFVHHRLRADGQNKADIIRLAKGEHPHSIVMSSSDSRVPPEIIFDQKLGEIFVTRSLGDGLGPNEIAAAEYAVSKLGVRFLLVLGHTQAGGAATDPWGNPQALAEALKAHSPVLSQAIESHQLVIRSAIYDLKTGAVKFE